MQNKIKLSTKLKGNYDPLFICSYCNQWISGRQMELRTFYGLPGTECKLGRCYTDCVKSFKWTPSASIIINRIQKLQSEISKLLGLLTDKMSNK